MKSYADSPPTLLSDKQIQDTYSWWQSNEVFQISLETIKMNTVARMPKSVTVKKNYQTQKLSLDKQKFLLRFVSFEGLLNFHDGKFEQECK